MGPVARVNDPATLGFDVFGDRGIFRPGGMMQLVFIAGIPASRYREQKVEETRVMPSFCKAPDASRSPVCILECQ